MLRGFKFYRQWNGGTTQFKTLGFVLNPEPVIDIRLDQGFTTLSRDALEYAALVFMLLNRGILEFYQGMKLRQTIFDYMASEQIKYFELYFDGLESPVCVYFKEDGISVSLIASDEDKAFLDLESKSDSRMYGFLHPIGFSSYIEVEDERVLDIYQDFRDIIGKPDLEILVDGTYKFFFPNTSPPTIPEFTNAESFVFDVILALSGREGMSVLVNMSFFDEQSVKMIEPVEDWAKKVSDKQGLQIILVRP